MMKLIRALPLLALFFAVPAHAEPTVALSERLTMPTKAWHVFIPLEIDASRGHAFEPVSIAPDVWYGLNPSLTLGIVHSQLGRTGFYGQTGDGLCFTGEKNRCENAYNNVGFEGRYHVYDGVVSLTANGGLHAVDLDELGMAAKFGFVASLETGLSTQIVLHPNLSVGLSERTREMETVNGETLFAPVTVMHNITDEFQFAWQVGLVLPFQDGKDRFSIPATAAIQWAPMQELALVGAFTFRSLIGGDAVDDGFDQRAFTLGTILHL